MAFANSAISDIIATTIQSRSGDLADNFTNNNAGLRRMKAKGRVKPFSGGNVILQELAYNDASSATVNSYSGYETINVGQNSPMSAAQYPITQYAASVAMSGLEMLQNSGKEQIIDLLDGRMDISEGQLMNRMSNDFYLDGTGNGGKNLTGLAAAISSTPTTGTYGGINRASFAFWQNVAYSGATNGGAAVSAANIAQYMTAVAIRLVRGTDKADLIVSGSAYFAFYVASLQAIQRINSPEGSGDAGSGFATLKFYGGGQSCDVVLDGGIYTGGDSVNPAWAGASASIMYFLNTNYLFLRPHSERNFVPIGGERQSVNQDAIVKLIGWAGNVTCSGSQFQGVLIP